MCMLDENRENLVTDWDVSGVPPEHKDGLYISLRDHLDARPWVLGAKTILIEKQPDRNKKMISVMHFLHSYGKAQYNKRKKVAIQRCEEFIRSNSVNSHWIDTFVKSKKKDDLADTVMQALSFVNRVEVTPASKKKKSTKLVAQ